MKRYNNSEQKKKGRSTKKRRKNGTVQGEGKKE